MTTVKWLLSEAENYSRHEWHPIPISAVLQRIVLGPIMYVTSRIYLERYFCSIQEVQLLELLPDSIKLVFSRDVDWLLAFSIFCRKILSKSSPGLQDKITNTGTIPLTNSLTNTAPVKVHNLD